MANIDKAVADRLSAKLDKFGATLSEDERAAFKSMLQEGGLSSEALEQVRGGTAGVAGLSVLRSHAARCW